MGEESLAAVVRQIAPADSGADKVQWIEGLVKEALLAKTGASIPPGRAEGPERGRACVGKKCPEGVQYFQFYHVLWFCEYQGRTCVGTLEEGNSSKRPA